MLLVELYTAPGIDGLLLVPGSGTRLVARECGDDHATLHPHIVRAQTIQTGTALAQGIIFSQRTRHPVPHGDHPEMKASEYLKAWKKAKPLVLTRTGISELLRTLAEDLDDDDIETYAEVAKELKAKAALPKIKGEKKAVACLVLIEHDIEHLSGVAHSKPRLVYDGVIIKRDEYPAVDAVATIRRVCTGRSRHSRRAIAEHSVQSDATLAERQWSSRRIADCAGCSINAFRHGGVVGGW